MDKVIIEAPDNATCQYDDEYTDPKLFKVNSVSSDSIAKNTEKHFFEKEFNFYKAYALLPPEAIRELVNELNMQIDIPELTEEDLLLKLHYLMDRKYFQYKPEVKSGI